MEFVVIGVLAVAGLIGAMIAKSKGRDQAEGCALGCLLGPVGWLIEFFLADKNQEDSSQSSTSMTTSSTSPESQDKRPRRKCPHCAEIILLEANVCKHCGLDVEPGDETDRVVPCPYCDAPISPNADECPQCLMVEPFE